MKGNRIHLWEFSIPNVLSLFRLILIPVFVVVFFTNFANHLILAGGILILSGVTDVLDGIIARRYHMITELGKVLDPLADKLTQATVCICMVIWKNALFWLLVLFVIKEGLMIAGGARMFKRKIIVPSKWYGKLATVLFYVVMIAIILFEIPQGLATVLILIVLLSMVFAFAMYLRIYLRLIARSHADKET